MQTKSTDEKKPTAGGGLAGAGCLAARQEREQPFTQGSYFSLLRRRVDRLAVSVLLVLGANLGIAGEGSGDAPALEDRGLCQEEIHVSRGQLERRVGVLAVTQQNGTRTVDGGVPLLAPMQPEVAAKTKNKADGRTDRPNNSAVGVDPAKNASVFQWVSFWVLCAVLGYFSGGIVGSFVPKHWRR